LRNRTPPLWGNCQDAHWRKAAFAPLAGFAGNGFCSLNNPLYYVLPSYQDFNVFNQVLRRPSHWKDIVFLSLCAADFAVIMLLLAWWRFHTKELV